MYKTLSSRTLLTHPRLTVVEDQVGLPDGQTGDYIWFSGGRSGITLLARAPDGRFLVQQEYSYVPGTRLYQLPGGGMDEGETPEVAANRELQEEAGLFANRLALLGSYYVDHRLSTRRMFVFLAEEFEERQPAAKDKYEVDLTTAWFTGADIDRLIGAGEILNAHMLASWAIYRTYLAGRAEGSADAL